MLELDRRLAARYRRGGTPPPGPSASGPPLSGTAPDLALAHVQAISTAGRVRAFACDDGGPIDLRYEGPAPVSWPAVAPGRGHAASTLPHHFESFAKPSMPEQQVAAPNVPVLAAPQTSPPATTAAPSSSPGTAPPPVSEPRAAPAPATEDDIFLADLQDLLAEANRRAATGQETPAISPVPATQPQAVPAPAAPTADAPTADASGDGADRHAVFDTLGQSLQRATTFDMGTVQVDKTFAAIEASIEAREREARRQRSQARATRPQAPPLTAIQRVEDMALITDPGPAQSAPELSAPSEEPAAAPLAPDAGGRTIPTSAVLAADLVILTPAGAAAPAAALYVGSGELVLATGDAVIRASMGDAIAGSTSAVVLRRPGLGREQVEQVIAFAIQGLGKGLNRVGTVRPVRMRLDQGTFCGGLSGDDLARCAGWIGTVDLGTDTNDAFACPELIVGAFASTGVPIATPIDNAEMSQALELRLVEPLLYVGHLHYTP